MYSFTLLNTGNVTLFEVAVDDPMLGDLAPDALDLLTPAVPATVSAEPYAVTPGDVAAGEIVNVALARGTLADGTTAVESQEDAVTVPARTDPMDPPVVGDLPAAGDSCPPRAVSRPGCSWAPPSWPSSSAVRRCCGPACGSDPRTTEQNLVRRGETQGEDSPKLLAI